MIQADITRWYNSTNRLAQTSPLSVFYLQTISHLSSKNGSRHHVKYLQETRTNVTLAIRWLAVLRWLAVHEIRKNQLIILEFLSHWKLQWKKLSSQVSAILLHKEWGRKTKRNFKKAHIPLDDSYPYNLEVLIILESPLSDSTDFHWQVND